jgi:hypothetical protein
MGSDDKRDRTRPGDAKDGGPDAQEMATALANVRPVTFAFAWRPKSGALIYVRTLKLDGHHVVVPDEGRDVESPFVVPLGIFKPGATLNLEWELRSFNELTGIKAMYHVGNAPDWQAVPDGGKNGLEAGVLWQGSGKIRVG